MNAQDNKKQTGRTTRMLQHALALSRQRRAVYVVMHNSNSVKHAQSLLDHLASANADDLHHGIKIETEQSIGGIDWQHMKLRGNPWPNCVLLVDHFAIEAKFQTALAMMTAFDTSPVMPACQHPPGTTHCSWCLPFPTREQRGR